LFILFRILLTILKKFFKGAKMSRSEQFFKEFSKLLEDKQRIHLPRKATYDEISNFLIDGKKLERNRIDYSNWKKRLITNLYTIYTKSKFSYLLKEIDNKDYVLYKGEKRVVYYEELYDLLHKSHVENTGHGGRDIMMKDLKGFYGISRFVICFKTISKNKNKLKLLERLYALI
jgi:hypothetical protein